MATQPKQFVTLEEYFEQERTAPERHEYLNGEVSAMAGGTRNHSVICSNLNAALHTKLHERDCTVFDSNMRLGTSPTGLYSYADVVVSCPEEQIENDTLLNPAVIAEVLAKSTESDDRSKKFEMYRQIPSFREYLIVAQDRPHVEHYVRNKDDARAWTLREYTSLEDTISLETIHVELLLADIMRKFLFRAKRSE